MCVAANPVARAGVPEPWSADPLSRQTRGHRFHSVKRKASPAASRFTARTGEDRSAGRAGMDGVVAPSPHANGTDVGHRLVVTYCELTSATRIWQGGYRIAIYKLLPKINRLKMPSSMRNSRRPFMGRACCIAGQGRDS